MKILKRNIQYAIGLSCSLLIALSNSTKAETPAPHANDQIEITGDASTIVPEPNNCPHCAKIALVLGGGGCKSLAQIGVLKVFAKNNIPINYIVGTSAGAIVGSLYAAGVPIADIENMAYDGSLQKAMSLHIILHLLTLPFCKIFYIGQPQLYGGLTSSSRIEKFLHKRLPADFTSLPIPFAAVATDLESGNTCMITSGNLCKAVAASSAVPLLVRPVIISDTIFVDGGIKANLPTNCAQLTKCELIVAVPADAPIRNESKRKFRSLKGVALRITNIMEAEIDKYRWKEADLVIYPNVADTPGMTRDADIIKNTIASGEKAANEALPRLKELIQSKSVHSK